MKRKLFISGIIASVVLGGALMVGANDSVSEEAKKDIISHVEAEEKALQEVNGQVEGIELEKKNGKIVYEVEIENQDDDKDVYVDGHSGDIVAVTDDDDTDDFFQKNESKISTNTEIISSEEAIKIAEKAVDGKSYSIEKDHDDGRVKYEIELKTSRGEVDVEIDGKTGKVIEIDYED